ncbi:hypothetical protein [Actinoplanes sp. NPDC051851]|uniref:hypothetical protein n=1 Tax=Actinoplanes sp. NPDC051851 TaxID=3154753 RepID=UPI00343EAD88
MSTMRRALLALAGFWTVGVLMLVGSRYGSSGLDRFHDAPTCSPAQTFTATDCRATVGATLTALTNSQATMDVDGRRVSAGLTLHGQLPGDAVGQTVRVTLYRGTVVHLEGAGLNVDTDDTPVDHTGDFRLAGLFLLIGGTILVGAGTLIRSGRSTRYSSSSGTG